MKQCWSVLHSFARRIDSFARSIECLVAAHALLQAVKIALETKKYLVDNNLQDVTQVRSNH